MGDAGLFGEFLSPEEQDALVEASRKVEHQLVLAGLPVHWKGNSQANTDPSPPGATVFYDPARGPSSGLFVTWRSAPELGAAAIKGGPDSPEAVLGGAWLRVMLEALGGVLTVAGWEVDSVNVGVHGSSIKIVV